MHISQSGLQGGYNPLSLKIQNSTIEIALYDGKNNVIFHDKSDLVEEHTAVIKNMNTPLDYDISVEMGRTFDEYYGPTFLTISFGSMVKVSFADTDVSKTPHCNVGKWDHGIYLIDWSKAGVSIQTHHSGARENLLLIES